MGYTLKIYETKDTTYEEITSLSLESYSNTLRRLKDQFDSKETEHNLQFVLNSADNSQNIDDYEYLFQKNISKLLLEKTYLNDNGEKKQESFEFIGYNLVRILQNSRSSTDDNLIIEFEK